MKTYQIDKLNLEDLDVETMEQRLEMTLLVHPLIYDCSSYNACSCAAKTCIE